MKTSKAKQTRRAFFALGGSAAMATAVGAPSPNQSQPQLVDAEEREAIRRAAAEMFVSGQSAVLQLFADGDAVLSAYRQHASQLQDVIGLSEDRLHATATFHVEVEFCTPLQDDCTAAQMAILQGNLADRRWEKGRFEAQFAKTQGEWKMTSLSYQGESA
jgi:hypothetical protein